MTDDSQSEDDVVNSEQAVEFKNRHASCEPKWESVLCANVDLALDYANEPPISQPGTILFNTLANGKVRIYAFGYHTS